MSEISNENAVTDPATDLIDDDVKVVEPEVAVETPKEDKPARKNQSVQVDAGWTGKDGWDENADTLAMPADFDKETRDILQKAPNINLLDNPQSRDWAGAVKDGLDYTTFNEAFVPTLEDDTADFKQAVDFNGTRLDGRQPKFKPVENQNLKGERGVIRMMSFLGLGTLFQTPLWHTGIWLTFKAPTESEIIELNRILISDKIRFGRATYGMAFSNTTSFTIDRLVDFALDHVYDSTLKSDLVGTRNLKTIISSQDIPSLIWGFVCTMYPRGFQYRRGCVADAEKCNHILEETLNLSKLLWVNNAALTDWQKTHMSQRQSATKDLPSVERYKEELSRTQKKRVSCKGAGEHDLFITLKTPTIAQYTDAGYRWVSEIVDLVDKALGQEETPNERNTYIVRHGQASAMRQYVHWVDSIEFETNTIDDSETIESTFNMLSSDNTIRNTFVSAVVDYINSSTIAVVGIPLYDCPACGTVQESNMDMPNHKNIIPLDVVQLFFGLLSQRLGRLVER